MVDNCVVPNVLSFAAMTAVLISSPAFAQNTKITSFAEAKRLAHGIYEGHRLDYYCGCVFDPDLKVDPSGCGYVPKSDTVRAHRIEWEHLVPAEFFGSTFDPWTTGSPRCVDPHGKAFKGRACAEKASPDFDFMEADLYNCVICSKPITDFDRSRSLNLLQADH